MVALAGCGGGRDDAARQEPDGVSTSTEQADDELIVGDLERRYGEELSALGMRISRAGRSAGTAQEYSGEGNHLAVYVAPSNAQSPDEAVSLIAPVAKIFLPDVFTAFDDVESFDVCQEPFAPDADAPEPLTQLIVEKRNSRAIDWSALTLESLVEATRMTPNRAILVVRGDAAESTAWKVASAG